MIKNEMTLRLTEAELARDIHSVLALLRLTVFHVPRDQQ
jgi:hypothetical protein